MEDIECKRSAKEGGRERKIVEDRKIAFGTKVFVIIQIVGNIPTLKSSQYLQMVKRKKCPAFSQV